MWVKAQIFRDNKGHISKPNEVCQTFPFIGSQEKSPWWVPSLCWIGLGLCFWGSSETHAQAELWTVRKRFCSSVWGSIWSSFPSVPSWLWGPLLVRIVGRNYHLKLFYLAVVKFFNVTTKNPSKKDPCCIRWFVFSAYRAGHFLRSMRSCRTFIVKQLWAQSMERGFTRTEVLCLVLFGFLR